MAYVTLTKSNIDSEHICCAFSDKKCSEGYARKKQWLTKEFEKGYVFKRLDERAKVFIEYGPAEKAWLPITAPNYINLGCFWVSGKYKGNGHGKALLQEAVEAAKSQDKEGLVSVVGTKKYHFMSDTKWLLGEGFEICETVPSGFSLVSMDFNKTSNRPQFNDSVKNGECPVKNGIAVYYSNRCPYSEYHVRESLTETAAKRNLSLSVIKLETMDQAQSAPTPCTIFSMFINGQFVTTDISVCMDSRFDKIVGKV
ncbi:N-acetyltransferase [Desulforegula conservatrix]|uniref:N-acetyltransferase n=1 Tax=Desulforegula conservatrix TaxID=153026 RepID=UPI000414B665|nr:N-acetyltransferase [Desulforegula conservatrix]